jgi:hypothetical protein
MAKKPVKSAKSKDDLKPVKLNKNVTALQPEKVQEEVVVPPKGKAPYGHRRGATISTEAASQLSDEHRKTTSVRIKAKDGIHIIDPTRPVNCVAPSVKSD